jgi:hypothetical protein
MNDQLELIPGQGKPPEPLFKSEHDYQEFRRTYTEEIAPRLEQLREARRQSEEQSKKHWMS